jgi:hypothetical protein
LRFPGRGKGKSGGYRVVYFYGPVDVPVFLLILIDKGDEEDISQAVRNALKAECDELIKEYRASVRSKARAHRARAQREGKR